MSCLTPTSLTFYKQSHKTLPNNNIHFAYSTQNRNRINGENVVFIFGWGGGAGTEDQQK